MPITLQWWPPGRDVVGHRLEVAGGGGHAPDHTHHEVRVQRRLEQAHVEQRLERADVAEVEALVLGLDLQPAHRFKQLDDLLERVCEHELEDEVLALARVLGVIHRAHVERRHLGTAGLEVGDPLGHRHPDGAGGEVDDRRGANLRPNGVADRDEVLHLVARRPVGATRVDVDVDAAFVHDPPRLRRVLLRRVGDRRALIAPRDHAGDRAGQNDWILETHTGTTPPLFQGRCTRLPAASSSARQIVGRVSRGSMTSSIMSLPAAT